MFSVFLLLRVENNVHKKESNNYFVKWKTYNVSMSFCNRLIISFSTGKEQVKRVVL